jgi:hypothetical protein
MQPRSASPSPARARLPTICQWRVGIIPPTSPDRSARAAQRRVLPAGATEQAHHRPKWQLVLDMLDELAGWDLVPPVLVADCGYGEVGEFRSGLDDREIAGVVSQVFALSRSFLVPLDRGPCLREASAAYRPSPCSGRGTVDGCSVDAEGDLDVAAGCVEYGQRRSARAMRFAAS